MILDWAKDKRWRVAAKVTAKGWNAEVEIPWADLGGKPRENQPWGFGIIRFSWTSGSSYVGAVSSPGLRFGSGKDKFALMLFDGDPVKVFDAVQLVLAKRNGIESWTSSTFEYKTYSDDLNALRQDVDAMSRQCRALLGRHPQDVRLLEKLKPIEADIESGRKVCAQASNYQEWQISRKALDSLKKRLYALQYEVLQSMLIRASPLK